MHARTDRDTANDDVYGDWTYLDDGTGRGTAFEFTGYPAAESAGCSGYPCSGDYVTPARTANMTRTPYFTWKAIAGALSYFVIVSKDANFTSIVDYGFTHVPAYAPRTSLEMRAYTDESTSYYWVVLPSPNYNGNNAVGNPLLANEADFQKQSIPPSLLYPAAGQTFSDQPTFRWSPAEGARRYRLQVASDPTFSNPLDDVAVDSTSYTSNTTYPADTVLYWRVRADDEVLNGLTWSPTGTFQKTLVAPVPSASNPTAGDMLPVWSWSPVQGASSYDVVIDQPNGQSKSFSVRSPLISFIKMTGTGIWHWRVRAEFPKAGSGQVPGPYSASQTFTRTISQPANARTDATTDHVLLAWDPKLGVRQYKVQISSTPDFASTVDSVTTDNTSYAPTMTSYGYTQGGTLYWRVAGVDEDRNQGDWSSDAGDPPAAEAPPERVRRRPLQAHEPRDGDSPHQQGQAPLPRGRARQRPRHQGSQRQDEQAAVSRPSSSSRVSAASSPSARRSPASSPRTGRSRSSEAALDREAAAPAHGEVRAPPRLARLRVPQAGAGAPALHDLKQRGEGVVLDKRPGAATELQAAPVVPVHRHADAIGAGDVVRRAGDEQRAFRVEAQRLEREPVRLRAWLVRAGGLGGGDDVERDADLGGSPSAELVGTVRDDADLHGCAQLGQNRGRLRPGPELTQPSNEHWRKIWGKTDPLGRLDDELVVRPIVAGRVAKAAVLKPPATA